MSGAASLEKAFSRCENRIVKMNGAIYRRTVSSVAKQRRRRLVMSFEMVRLNRASSEPLYQQLYRQIRKELESGCFDSSASRVPSSRVLAATLGISRLTVNQAFSKLLAEGYLQARERSGIFVADHLPATFLKAAKPVATTRTEHPPRVARRVTRMTDSRTGRELDVGVAGPPSVTFVAGLPAVDEFPIAVWERLREQVLATKGAHLLRYASSRGEIELRKAIATYLCDFRGANCHPEQIIVVGGMQQAMLACALGLINEGEVAWIEDPGFHQARNVLAFVGAKVVPRPVDREGLVIGKCPNSPRVIFVAPSHQFPLGVTMSLKRRKALIEFAESRDGYILEDDYNSEFRFDGAPLPCLQGLDNASRVIYAGTMSKILYPSLRLGFLIAPPQLVDTLVKVRAVMDQHSPAIDQATLARFITEGFFLSHVKRMRELYAQRRVFFIEQFQKWLGDYFDLEITPAGLHFIAWLRRKEDLALFMRAREQAGVWPRPLSFFCIKAQLDPAFVFGFAAWSQAQIEQSLIKLASAVKQLKQRGAGNGSSFQTEPFSPAPISYWPLTAIRSK